MQKRFLFEQKFIIYITNVLFFTAKIGVVLAEFIYILFGEVLAMILKNFFNPNNQKWLMGFLILLLGLILALFYKIDDVYFFALNGDRQDALTELRNLNQMYEEGHDYGLDAQVAEVRNNCYTGILSDYEEAKIDCFKFFDYYGFTANEGNGE